MKTRRLQQSKSNGRFQAWIPRCVSEEKAHQRQEWNNGTATTTVITLTRTLYRKGSAKVVEIQVPYQRSLCFSGLVNGIIQLHRGKRQIVCSSCGKLAIRQHNGHLDWASNHNGSNPSPSKELSVWALPSQQNFQPFSCHSDPTTNQKGSKRLVFLEDVAPRSSARLRSFPCQSSEAMWQLISKLDPHDTQHIRVVKNVGNPKRPYK